MMQKHNYRSQTPGTPQFHRQIPICRFPHSIPHNQVLAEKLSTRIHLDDLLTLQIICKFISLSVDNLSGWLWGLLTYSLIPPSLLPHGCVLSPLLFIRMTAGSAIQTTVLWSTWMTQFASNVWFLTPPQLTGSGVMMPLWSWQERRPRRQWQPFPVSRCCWLKDLSTNPQADCEDGGGV